MKCLLQVVLGLILTAAPVLAQCPLTGPQAGDYRSKKDGLWQQAENWEAWDGSGWVGVASTAWPGSPDAQPPRTSVCNAITVASYINAPKLEGDLEVADGAVIARSSAASYIEFSGFRARNEGTVEVGTFYLARTGPQVLSGPGAWIPLNLDVNGGSTFRLDEDLTVETTVRIAANAELALEGHTLTMTGTAGASHTLDALGPVRGAGTIKTMGQILISPDEVFSADLHVESGEMQVYGGTYQGGMFVAPSGNLLVRSYSVAVFEAEQFLLYGSLGGQQGSELVFTGGTFHNESPSPVTVPDLTFAGSGDQTLAGSGDYIDMNLGYDSPGQTLVATGGTRVHGRLTLRSGNLNLDGGEIDLGDDGRLDEQGSSRVYGSGVIRAVRSQNALGQVDVGIGFRLRSVPLGDTIELRRGHDPQFDGGIDRWYEIGVDEALNHDLNASIEGFEILPEELEGHALGDLSLYRLSTDGSHWEEMGGTATSTGLQLTGVDHFSRWTAGPTGLTPVNIGSTPDTPNEFRLHGAYPNPFRSLSTLELDLPSRSRVRIEVFDILGRRVRALVDGSEMTAGSHGVTWDARDDAGAPVAGGTYFAKVTVGGVVRSTALTLLR